MIGNAPAIAVEQVGHSRRISSGDWLIDWRAENRSAEDIVLISARVPHGKFQSNERRFEPATSVAAGASTVIRFSVRCEEPPGSVVENAFLILLVEWLSATWRVFIRLRVKIDDSGKPASTTELITAQPVGFSGVSG